jgi:hypothetical protein
MRRPPTDYRDFAVECLRLARITEDTRKRTLYLTMAQAWMDLCDREEARLEADAVVVPFARPAQASP